jgi:hypothetical protein
MNISFPPFAPDKSPFDIGATQTAVNVLPVADGWGPMPGLTIISSALPAPCLGAVYVRTAIGNYRVIAGTETRLYELNTTDFTWTDISGPSAPYAVPLGDSWTFTRFGSRLVAHTIGDVIQVYDIEVGGNFANLAGSPPKAKYSWVAADFLVLGYIDGTNGQKTVQWSGLNNIEYWTIGKNNCDLQELPEGDEVMGGFGEQGGFYVIQRAGMQYFPFAPGSNFTFTRTVLNPKQGTISPRSIVSIGPAQFFYLSEDGFFNGVNRQPIGAERVDKWFLEQIDTNYLAEVQGAADPYEKIVWWRYRTINGTYYRLGYDWQLDRWCTTDLQVTEMVALATPGMTWDGLAALYADIDAVSEPFDSRLFAGGRPTFATFTTDNKLAYFSGSNLLATIESADVEFDGMTRAFISGCRVSTDAQNFTLQDGVRDFHGGSITWSAAESPNARSGLVPFRSDGRLHKIRMIVPEGEDWSITSSVNATASATGEL